MFSGILGMGERRALRNFRAPRISALPQGFSHPLELSRKLKAKVLRVAAFGVAAFCGVAPVHAQWQTQSLTIQPGWTAVYLHVDASYQTLDNLVGSDPSNPIAEVWLWQAPASTLQFVTSPQAPVAGTTQWANWGRIGTGITSTLFSLVPNAAYLIHSTATTNYTWNLKGRPVAPNYAWSTTGENFQDFPTVSTNPPAFDAFLSLAPSLASVLEVFQYQGGPLGPINPSQVFAFHSTPVVRGQAFWMRSGTVFNNYFGPFQANIQTLGGVAFSNSVSQYSFHLVNPTVSSVTVSLQLLPSESPPAGQTAIVGVPPLLVRGALTTSNLTYAYTSLTPGNSVSWTLTPQGQSGSDIVVVLGLNRYVLTSNPGALYAGILRFTDSLGYTEVDAPVSAQVASYAGLWVGNAAVSQVSSYLKSYQMDANNQPIVGSNGAYTVTGINTNLGPVVTPFPLRLILHNSGSQVSMLQRVFYGNDINSNTIVALNESSLDPAQLASARRISAIHLPWSAVNAPFQLSGQLAPGATLATINPINFDYNDQSSNPFLHTYHPDHDNLDATFTQELPQGSESYGIQRQITLSLLPPGNDFLSLTQAGQSFSGAYVETITMTGIGGATRTFNVAGTFMLAQISPIAVLSP